MMNYSDHELEVMLADLESDLTERKESLRGDAPSKAREAVCAFANDLPNHQKPGVVFIGARDDGTPSGLAITDQLLTQLADFKTDGNILPPPTLTVAKRRIGGAEMAIVTVQPADSPPVRCRGTVWIRIGPRRGIATAQDERVLNEKRRYRDRPFDIQPVNGASISDLRQVFFEETYLPAAFAPDILEANDRTYEQRLAVTKMTVSAEQPIPTVLGILVAGASPRYYFPGAYIQFLRIAGTELDDPIIDELPIDGSIDEVLHRIDDKLISHNRHTVDIVTNPTEQRAQPYPLPALQQLVRNAVLHRTYEGTNAPVRVYWYDDRIEIINPGGPHGAVTSENFGSDGITDYRNPNLAEALRVLGYVQRFGVGIRTARGALARNGNPSPQFSVDSLWVSVIVRAVK